MRSLRIYKIDTQSPIHSDICFLKNQIIRKIKKSKQSNYKNGVDFLLGMRGQWALSTFFLGS